MRNLVTRSVRVSRLDTGRGSGLLKFCINPETEEIFYATKSNEIGSTIGAWQVPLSDTLLADVVSENLRVTCLAYSLELEALCLTTSAGHLLLLEPASKTFEEVGVIDGGVVAAEWSPEGELLALVTGGALLMVMNKDFEVLAEVPLLAMPQRVVPSRKLPAEDPQSSEIPLGGAVIAWRGDGKYFATTSCAGPDGQGILRVWERDGCALHSIGEHTEGLQCVVAWQPNGQHIYAAQQLGGRPRVVLFERNGLQHGSIGITGEGTIQGLQWSSDSELLAVHLAAEASLPPGIHIVQSAGNLSESHAATPEEPSASPATEAATSSVSNTARFAGEVSGSQTVQVWQRSNWHWYLKQERRHAECHGLQMQWSEEGHVLTTCTSDGFITRVELGSSVGVSALGTVAVVDGPRLLLTPLRHSVVPPPLAAVRACFSAPVQCFAFQERGPQEVIAAALSDGSLAVLRSIEADLWEETLEEAEDQAATTENDGDNGEAFIKATRVELETPLSVYGAVRCLVWTEEHRILAIIAPPLGDDSAGDILVDLSISWQGLEASASALPIGNAEGEILTAVSHPQGGALLQLSTGRLLHYAVQEGSPEALMPYSEEDCFPKPCPQMLATPLAAADAAGSALAPAVGLTAAGELFLGQHLLASNVTSFTMRDGGATGAQLLYTSRHNFLHTRLFEGILAEADAQPVLNVPNGIRGKRPKALGEGRGENHYPAMHAAMRGHGASAPASGGVLAPRAVEQGSRIIAAPPSGYAVVLQMPRGNLETAYPRSLVLPALAVAIQEGRFADVWQVATVHRVDLNLLVDYGWPRFLRQADRFVAEVPYDQDLADLLAALRPESVVADGGLYGGLPAYPAEEGDDTASELADGKVAAVCRTLRGAMQATNADLYLKPILASHTVLGELEAALGILKAAKEAQIERETSHQSASTSGLAEDSVKMGLGDLGQWRRQQTQTAPTAEEGLGHLLLTVNVEQLYRAALGMYELEVAYMVLAHSPQHDPGEYLLELQGFAAKPAGPLRRHAIDLYLGRMSSALRNLVDAGKEHFGAALSLARKEGLLRELLSHVGDSLQRKEVLKTYGEWLAERSMHEDAAVALLAAGELESALVEYKSGGFWQMALAVAGRLGWESEQMRDLAEELVDNLSNSSRLQEAATVAAQHLSDADTAAALLSQAREWREALRMTALFQRQDLVETTVAPSAAEAAAALLAELGETKERIAKYDARLAEVRVRRAAMQAALDDGGGDGEGEGPSDRRDFDDTVSEGGSSVVSGLSAYSQASTGAASTQASTGRSPSTVGGKRPQRKSKKGGKGPRIRQGSPQEEAALVAHIDSLAPSPRQCTEAGQLTELLILLGHEADARQLQALLSTVIAQQKAAAERAAEGVKPAEGSMGAKAPAKQEERGEDVNWKWDILRPV